MKRGQILFLTFVLLISFSSASLSIKNVSLKDRYYSGEPVSGKINLSITDELLDSEITSNLNQSVSVRDFLKKNNADFSCSSFNCSPIFNASNPENARTIQLNYGDLDFFGFLVNGQNVQITNISFKISSNFNKSNEIPLKIKFFEQSSWNYKDSSSDFTRSGSSGCFEPDSIINQYEITGQTTYCEKIALPETQSVKIGARVIGDNKELKMIVLGANKAEIASCIFSPPNDSCIANYAFSYGDYYICIKLKENAASTYKIFSESSNESCGWSGTDIARLKTENSSADYDIFAYTPKYDAAKDIFINSALVPGLVSNANLFLQQRYNKNCSSGCVLPVEVSGVNQSLTISDIVVNYMISTGSLSNNKAYLVSKNPVKFNFTGILDLAFTGFNVTLAKGSKYLRLDFKSPSGTTSLFNKNISIVSSSKINYISPINPPAGVMINLTADIENDANITRYVWTFNQTRKETTKNTVQHIFNSVGIHDVTLNITDINNISISKTFQIYAGSPSDLINITLNHSRSVLNHAIQSINKFPAWYQKKLESMSNISFYQDEIAAIERKRANALTDEDFLELLLEINALNAPYSVNVEEIINSPLITSLEDADPEPVAAYTGGELDAEEEKYKNAILQWQNENIQATIRKQAISLIKSDSSKTRLITLYNLNIQSFSDEESYFVISKPFEDIYFNQGSGRKQGSNTLVVIDEAEKNLEFYVIGDEPVFFASPKLSSLQLESEVGICNFNKACEEGETYKNCRSDCKPVGWTIFYIILTLFLGLIAYTSLQMWYKARYETFLFTDRKYLFNLTMFITNARLRGISDEQISEMLKKQNWSKEQIIYAIKKSRGERTGMYEIVPVEKLFAYLREKKEKQNINKGQEIRINKW